MLQCRSAYLVAGLFLFIYYWNRLPNKKIIRFNRALFIIPIILIPLLLSRFKEASSAGRIQIWQNSIRLAYEKPLIGQGFGLFEKQYNKFIATNPSTTNDHVNMPYNDFLELAVEGGVIAMLFWLAFIIEGIQYYLKHKKSISLFIALLIIQITNFGFEAIPAFTLFLMYLGLETETIAVTVSKEKNIGRFLSFKTWISSILIIAFILFIYQVRLAEALHKRNEITKTSTPAVAINAYAELSQILNGFSSYHESYGDAFLQTKQYLQALSQFLQATKSSSPEILLKCGYCYEMLKQYDSSEYYYTLIHNMQPYKFIPQNGAIAFVHGKR